MTPDKKTVNAVVYMRVAQKDQLRMQEQRRLMKKYAKDHGYIIVSYISDNGVSGLRNSRAVQKILEETRKYKCKLAICLKASVLSREPSRLMKMLFKLESEGISVECAQEQLPSKQERDAAQNLIDHVFNVPEKKS